MDARSGPHHAKIQTMSGDVAGVWPHDGDDHRQTLVALTVLWPHAQGICVKSSKTNEDAEVDDCGPG